MRGIEYFSNFTGNEIDKLMNIAEYLHFSLPLSNPILIFSVILFVILFSPIILNKMSIPPLVGLIIAGIIIGPNGFNFIDRDSSIELFGTVGYFI
jgi:Kef-type K+ transport system membrane component KefB